MFVVCLFNRFVSFASFVCGLRVCVLFAACLLFCVVQLACVLFV